MKKTQAKRLQWGTIGAWMVVFTAFFAVNAGALAQNNVIQVSVGEAVTLPGENIAKLAVADPTVADVVPLSDRELSVIGKKAGITTLTMVRSDGRATQTYRIEVGNDAAAAAIRQMTGQTTISVRAVGDTLVLDGHVDDELQAQRAVQVATAYKDKVLNLLEVRNPRQIKVRTRVAEVNSSAIRNIGLRWMGTGGQVQYALDYTGGGSIIHGLIQPGASGGATGQIDPTTADAGLDVVLSLLMTKGYARLLSEPTLVTLSGKEASFLVGEERPIVQQLPQSFTVEFKEVGVRMRIKPTADSQNQINTTVLAEVSQVIGTTSEFEIPIIGSKKAETTLQVRDGQTIVIGGLLENNISRDTLRKVPWLADIPLFGFLFRNKQFEQAQREVLFFVTPEIVKDIDGAVASAAQTPLMQEWHGMKADEKLLEVPNPREDWGLHNPDGLGFPEGQRRTTDTGAAPSAAAPAAAPVAAPVAVTPTEAPAAWPTAAPAAAPVTAPVAKPAPAPAPVPTATRSEPTTNFGPARPAGE